LQPSTCIGPPTFRDLGSLGLMVHGVSLARAVSLMTRRCRIRGLLGNLVEDARLGSLLSRVSRHDEDSETESGSNLFWREMEYFAVAKLNCETNSGEGRRVYYKRLKASSDHHLLDDVGLRASIDPGRAKWTN